VDNQQKILNNTQIDKVNCSELIYINMISDSDTQSSKASSSASEDKLQSVQEDDYKGLNRHKLSPESMRQILQHQEADVGVLCGDGQYLHSSRNDSSFQESDVESGVFSGAANAWSQWMHLQRIRRQKIALEKAVEAQRKILFQEVNNSATEYEEDIFGSILDQSINIHSDRGVISRLTSCAAGCINDDSDNDGHLSYEFDDDSRLDFENYMTSVQTEINPKNNSNAPYCDESMPGPEGSIRIGKPCHSLSGQGVMVQLELLGAKDDSIDNLEINVHRELNSIPFILNSDQMRDIAADGLPASITFAKWKRLYCLQRDGDSFANAFMRKLKGVERSLLVIQTTNNEILGGYSNSPWESQGGSVGAAFYGSCQASLFKINKHTKKVQCFGWTGANRYIQVCDKYAKLLALGGGGKDGAFGLCVEDDFTVGTTGKCETFDNEPLCEEGRFEILNVECWGFLPSF
jgi:hypothetical protein